TAMTRRVIGSLGDGLLSSDGDFHRQQRRLAQPAFHHKRIEMYAQVMVEHTKQMLKQWHSGEVCQIHREMMKVTLGIASKTLFNADVSAVADSLHKPISTIFEILDNKFNSFLNPPPWLPTRRNLREKHAFKAVNSVINGFIEEHRVAGDNGDLLSMLMQ